MKRVALVLVSVAALACGSDNDTTGSGGNTTSTGTPTGTATGTATGTSDGGGGTSNAGGAGGTGGMTSAGGAGGMTGTGGGGGMTGAGGGGGSSNACIWSAITNPCGNGMYCNAPGCGMGTCDPVTNVDDTMKVPVCGCDGVSYWNSVTASNHGMAVNMSGACNPSVFCGGFGNLPCPSNAHFCAYDVTALGCNVSDAGGTCWGMPITCNIIGIGGGYKLCSDPMNPSCLYECEAIKLQQNYFVAPNLPPPQGCAM